MSPTNSKQISPETEKRDARKIRNPLAYALSVVLLVIIIIAFVVFPITTSGIQDNTKLIFGQYSGQDIAYKPGNFFEQQYSYNKQMLQAQSSSTGSDLFQEYSALKTAFDQTVLHTAILQEAARLGISVSEAKLHHEFLENGRFKDANGKFSQELLANYSQHDRANLLTLIKENLISDIVTNDLQSGPKVSTKEKLFIETMGTWQRSFNYVSLTADDYPDTELAAYGTSNKELFRSLELSQVSVATKELATNLRKQLVDGTAKFEEIVAAHSTDIYKDTKGSRGKVYFKDLKTDLTEAGNAEAVFALSSGSYSEVLSQSGSYVFFRADSVISEPDFANPDVLKMVRDYMRANERGKVEDYLSAKAKELAAAGTSLETVAASLGKSVKTTTSFPINVGGLVYQTMYGNLPMFPAAASSEGQAIGNAADRDAFFEAAFKIQKGQISEPVLLQDEVVVLELKDEQIRKPEEMQTYFGFDQFIQYLSANDVRAFVVKEDKLVDNFENTFSKNFIQ